METARLKNEISRGFAWSVLLNYTDSTGAQVDLTNYTPTMTVVNENRVSVSGFVFEKGSFSGNNLRIRLAEGNAIVGNQMLMNLVLVSSGDDIPLAQIVVGVS